MKNKLATNTDLLEHARSLRQTQTPAELRLWGHLRGSRLLNFKFRRQVTIGPYIVDFLCHEARLIIEIDGTQHQRRGAYDMQRTRYLERCGFQVLRYWNNEVMQHEENVMKGIDAHLHRHQHQHLSPSPGGRRTRHCRAHHHVR